MHRPSELEEFLQAEQQRGRTVSHGEFTLAREKALEKLAAYQLPFPEAWVLKIVQAAVASGAERLEIKQTPTDTLFGFNSPGAWSLARLEQAFLDPRPSGDPGLDHLVIGLRAASLNDGRPFQIRFPGGGESLVWSGRELEVVPSQATELLRLTVSHRTLAEGKGIPGWRVFQAARRNAEILKTLSERCFVCPVPLTVDGRRMDVLQFCPTHGYTGSSHPVALGWGDLDSPAMGLPPGTLEGYVNPAQQNKPSSIQLLSRGVLRPLTKEHPRAGVYWLATVHLKLTGSGKNKSWDLRAQPSVLYWVEDGVVLETEHLPVPSRAFSVAMFLSAAGLAHDLTGFGLVKDPERVRQGAAVVGAALAKIPLVSLEALVNTTADATKMVGIALCGLGVLSLFGGPQGLLLLGAGVIALQTAGSTVRAVESGVVLAQRSLLDDWTCAFQEG